MQTVRKSRKLSCLFGCGSFVCNQKQIGKTIKSFVPYKGVLCFRGLSIKYNEEITRYSFFLFGSFWFHVMSLRNKREPPRKTRKEQPQQFSNHETVRRGVLCFIGVSVEQTPDKHKITTHVVPLFVYYVVSFACMGFRFTQHN